MTNDFQAYSVEHLIAIALTFVLPFLLAALVRRTGSRKAERTVVLGLLLALALNYVAYMIFIRVQTDQSWREKLPMQMCDWAIVVIIVALLTANRFWFEVAYFWGVGGTLQAILTPDLHYGFPDFRFFSFFISHSGIVIGVLFLMLTRRLRPYPISVVRVFAWTEFYFVCALMVDLLTGVNYGYILHKPAAFSLLSYLSDSWGTYLLEFHLLALVFFIALYLPFAIYDTMKLARGKVVL